MSISRREMMRRGGAALLVRSARPLLAAEESKPAPASWQLQYFYDEDKSGLTIHDLKFVSLSRGVAVGARIDNKRRRPVVLTTSNGGAQWSMNPLENEGYSLFFLNDSIGWLVESAAIWKTVESGRSWKRLAKLPKVEQVFFHDEQNGWAVGAPKAIWRTTDGGVSWQPSSAADQVKTNPQTTRFSGIEFVSRERGAIVGYSRPDSADQELPWWLADEPLQGRELPSTTVFLSTADAGAHWIGSAASVFGIPQRLHFTPSGKGLALYRFRRRFEYTSEVYAIDLRTGESKSSLRGKDFTLTDVAFAPDGVAFAAGVERTSLTGESPVPGAVRIWRSTDLQSWTEMSVNYKAFARRVVLGVVDAGHAWAATDTGQVLRYTAA